MYTLSRFFPSFKSFSFSVSDSNCRFLSYIQTFQDSGKVIWYSHFLKNFPHFVVVLYVKGFSIISEADGNVFWDSVAFLYDPMDVGKLISGSSNQFLDLEILSSCSVEAYLEGF